jgi:hypothetical protein
MKFTNCRINIKIGLGMVGGKPHGRASIFIVCKGKNDIGRHPFVIFLGKPIKKGGRFKWI